MELTQSTAHLAAFLFSVSLKTLPIFAIAGLVCLGMRRASAASRHLLWAVTLASLLCLPAFCILLPSIPAPIYPAPLTHETATALSASKAMSSTISPRLPSPPSSIEANGVPAPKIALPQATGSHLSEVSVQQSSDSKTAPTAPVQDAFPLPQPKPVLPAAPSKPTGTEWLVAGWLIGAAGVLSRLTLGLLGAVRLVRLSTAVTSGPIAEAANEALRRLNLSTLPSVRGGSTVTVPMTFGVLRPIVLLPNGADVWPAERLQVVLLHEMGHIKRRDWLTAMLAEVVCAVYWFHPLVWLAARQLRTESEQACDDLVLTSGIQPTDYADHLLEVVRGLTKQRSSMPAVATMACKQDITARLKTILETSKNRNAATVRGLAVAMLTATFIVLPLAVVHPVASAQAEYQSHPTLGNPMMTAPAPLAPWTLMSSPDRLANLMAHKSRWEQKLPDGTRVRLLIVGAQDTQYNVIKSWTPDGILQQPDRASLPQPSIYGKHGYQFYYGITFTSAKRQNTAVLSYSQEDERSGMSGGVLPWHGGEAVQGNFPALFPEKQTKGTVSVHVATGPETTLIAALPLIGATRRLSTGETVKMTKALVKLYPEQHHLTQTTEVVVTLPTRYVQDMSEYSFYPVDWKGQPIRVQHAGSSIPDTTKKMAYMVFDFRTSELPLSHVKEFRFDYRPSQTATFRDVALRPDTASAQSGFAATTWAQTAGDAALRLVAVSDKPANPKRWWHPDGVSFAYDWHQFGLNFEHQKPTYPQAFFQQWPVLIFRLGHPSTSYVTIDGWQDPQAMRSTTGPSLAEYFCVGQDGSEHAGFTPILAKTPQSLSVRLRVGAGPWQVQDTKTQYESSDSLASWKITQFSRTQTDVLVQTAKGIKFQQVRLVAFDRQGREYAPVPNAISSTDKGNGLQTQYKLAVPLSQIRKIAIETRPYYYRDFYGIARQPIVSPVPASATDPALKEKSDREASLSNLHQIGLALVKYVTDHHERFPDAAHWMDQISPYLVPAQIKGAERQQRIAAIFHDPASPPNRTLSYAYNRALSGLSDAEVDAPAQVVAVFESSYSVRNASDGGQSVPQPGRHSGGSDFLFADAHTKWLRAGYTPLLWAELQPIVLDSSGNLTQPQSTSLRFAPLHAPSRQKIPIQGQIYDRRTMKPLNSTFVIFSQMPHKITAGSVWPSSFTDKAGRFQSILYPGKNYLMVLENDRFKLAGKLLRYEANGSAGSISTQGTKAGPPRSAQSDYIIHWSLPHTYTLQVSKEIDTVTGAGVSAFVPIIRSAL